MAFAAAWVELPYDEADLEDLLEKGRGLHRRYCKKDPRQVAAHGFERSRAPRRELIPGLNTP